MYQVLGILFIVAVFAVAIWWFKDKDRPNVGSMATILSLMALIGLVIFFNERISEISFGYLGTIKAASSQAVVDAKQVAEIRRRIEDQSVTTNLVARSASDSAKSIETLKSQVTSTTKQLSKEFESTNAEASAKIQRVQEALPLLNKQLDEARKSSADLAAQNVASGRRMEEINADIERKQSEIGERQAQLQREQEKLSVEVGHQMGATAAKSGDTAAYDKLRADAASSVGTTMESAKSALSEVEMYYDIDRGQLLTRRLVDPVSKQDPGYTIDEALVIIVENRDAQMREAAANTLSELTGGVSPHNVGLVEDLVGVLKREENLRVIARVTRLLQPITAQEFRPLDREVVLSWWNLQGCKDQRFLSPYGGLFMEQREEADEAFLAFCSPMQALASDQNALLAALDTTIKDAPDALFARCERARLLIEGDRFDEASAELDEVQKQRSDYRFMLLYRAVLLAERGNAEAAVIPLNAALKKSPVLEAFVRANVVFAPTISTGKVVWPSPDIGK